MTTNEVEGVQQAVHDENVAKMRVLLLEQLHLSLRIIAEELVHRIHIESDPSTAIRAVEPSCMTMLQLTR